MVVLVVGFDPGLKSYGYAVVCRRFDVVLRFCDFLCRRGVSPVLVCRIGGFGVVAGALEVSNYVDPRDFVVEWLLRFRDYVSRGSDVVPHYRYCGFNWLIPHSLLHDLGIYDVSPSRLNRVIRCALSTWFRRYKYHLRYVLGHLFWSLSMLYHFYRSKDVVEIVIASESIKYVYAGGEELYTRYVWRSVAKIATAMFKYCVAGFSRTIILDNRTVMRLVKRCPLCSTRLRRKRARYLSCPKCGIMLHRDVVDAVNYGIYVARILCDERSER